MQSDSTTQIPPESTRGKKKGFLKFQRTWIDDPRRGSLTLAQAEVFTRLMCAARVIGPTTGFIMGPLWTRPTIRDLSRDTNTSRSTLHTTITLLIQLGLIEERELCGRVYLCIPELVPVSQRTLTGKRLSLLQKRGITYADYLGTPEWKEKSTRLKKAAGGRCQVCNGMGVLNTHHRTYERVGEERDEDLIVLCQPCHELFSKNGKLSPPEE